MSCETLAGYLGEMMLLGVMGYPSLAAGTAGDRRIPPTASNGAACDISRRRRTATRILSREDRHGAPLSGFWGTTEQEMGISAACWVANVLLSARDRRIWRKGHVVVCKSPLQKPKLVQQLLQSQIANP